MINHEELRVVNHELWMEERGDLIYLMWGHYPNVDGRIDPLCIREIRTDDLTPAYLGMDGEGVFIETKAKSVGVVYERGFFVKVGGRWYFREVPYKGEALKVVGFSTYHRGEVKRLGLELEITVEDGKIFVYHRGKVLDGVVKIRCEEGELEVRTGERVDLKGLNVITFRTVEDTCPVKRSLVSTLTFRGD